MSAQKLSMVVIQHPGKGGVRLAPAVCIMFATSLALMGALDCARSAWRPVVCIRDVAPHLVLLVLSSVREVRAAKVSIWEAMSVEARRGAHITAVILLALCPSQRLAGRSGGR